MKETETMYCLNVISNTLSKGICFFFRCDYGLKERKETELLRVKKLRQRMVKRNEVGRVQLAMKICFKGYQSINRKFSETCILVNC